MMEIDISKCFRFLYFALASWPCFSFLTITSTFWPKYQNMEKYQTSDFGIDLAIARSMHEQKRDLYFPTQPSLSVSEYYK
jgi:aspartate aminotransferase-like enzyme